MRTIHKYSVSVTDDVAIEMPQNSLILHVAGQYGDLYLWALVDDQAPLETRHFKLRSTGYDCSGVGPYVGSFVLTYGGLVFHLFEA